MGEKGGLYILSRIGQRPSASLLVHAFLHYCVLVSNPYPLLMLDNSRACLYGPSN
jgi:hypothetical protein